MITTYKSYRAITVVILLSVLSLAFSQLRAQHSLELGYIPSQAKDSHNYGFVSPAQGFGLAYVYDIETEGQNLEYIFSLGADISSTNGSFGALARLEPAKLRYEWAINEDETIWIGGRFKTNWMAGIYPDLQMGHLLWLTNYSLSPSLSYRTEVDGQPLIIRGDISLFSLYSRRESFEPYFFDLSFGGIMSDLHRNMSLGMINELMDIEMEAFYETSFLQGLEFGLRLRYVAFFGDEEFQYIGTGLLGRYEL